MSRQEPYDVYLTEFVETMKWSPETPEDVRSLVLCNLQGFVAFLKEVTAEPPADTGPLSADDQQRIDKAYNAHVAEPVRSILNAFARKRHTLNCAYHLDQYEWECDCGLDLLNYACEACHDSGVIVIPNGHFADGSENNVEVDCGCRHSLKAERKA